jgi:hypothetical protein
MGKQRLKGFGNVEMRRIFWHKRKKVTGGWKKLYEEIYYLYF